MTRLLLRLYKTLLHLYPKQFHATYRQEMVFVFSETIEGESGFKSAILFLREVLDLPSSIYHIYAAQWSQGGNMSTQNEYTVPSTRWQALIGTPPFLGFGIVSMISKADLVKNNHIIYMYLAFFVLALSGVLIGWIRDFPLWSYGYLGWSLLFSWWWSNARINGIYYGAYIWMIFGIIVLIAFIWSRSLSPIKKVFKDISKDWTRLSLAMYTFIAFVFLIYDENHHPYLLFYMLASTLTIAAGAWFFLRSASQKGRVASIFVGLIASYVIGQICDKTWDAQAYYNLPVGSPTPWHMTVFRTVMILSLFAAILLWPAVISLYQRITNPRAEIP